MKTSSLHNHLFVRNFRTSIFVVLLSIITTSSFSQAYKDNWYFGSNIGLNFSSGTPQFVSGCQMGGNDFNHSTTMSDDFGNLLFYSNAQTIWNANNVPLTGLVGGFLSGSNNTSQGASFKNPANQNQ